LRNFSEDSCFKSDATRLQETYKTENFNNIKKSIFEFFILKFLDYLI